MDSCALASLDWVEQEDEVLTGCKQHQLVDMLQLDQDALSPSGLLGIGFVVPHIVDSRSEHLPCACSRHCAVSLQMENHASSTYHSNHNSTGACFRLVVAYDANDR